MNEYKNFKSLLEYFVAHLEFCVTENKTGRGYSQYIQDVENIRWSGQGYNGDSIQNQVTHWASYKNGTICLNVNAASTTPYKNRGSYLNWKSVAINVNAIWNNDTIKELKIVKNSYPTPNNAIDVLSNSVEELGLFDNNTPNDNLKSFFDRFNSLIIEWNKNKENEQIMENIKPYIDLLTASKNVILTGAPGTGKTFLAKQIAKQMIGVQTDEEFEKSEQFAFVQFHPSYDYTDFVEGLRPTNTNGNIGFELKNGIFKAFCDKALKNSEDSKKNPEQLAKEDIARNKIKEFLDNSVENRIEFTLKTGNKFTISEFDDTYIKVEVPNNSKTSELSLPLNELLTLFANEQTLTSVKEVGAYFSRSNHRQNDSYIFTLFNSDKLSKEIETIGKTEKIEKKPYVFVIDEINRGEISKIFGELFFAIDPSYRGKKGAVKTQYSNLHADEREVFYVPDNVYILGSMNDIDRSIESFDFAMRRRFTWLEITAEQSASNMKLPDKTKDKMKVLNEQISKIGGLNNSYHIGGAYFLDSDGNFRDDYATIWSQRIEPLLK